MSFQLIHGDSLIVLGSFESNSIDAIVTDPPYGLSFMGKGWDYSVPSEDLWRECLRVLKPGGHLLAFAGTRTQHRMAVRIEDAGFEIRDMIAWVYGSGFPKSLDVSKAIDKAAGAEHLRAFRSKNPADRPYTHTKGETSTGWQSPVRPDKTYPATEAAKQWEGWGTALKPALEPITVARKPFIGTVAENVLAQGTGALNIDGCRVETDELRGKIYNNKGDSLSWGGSYGKGTVEGNAIGRWPANLIHDGSEEVVGLFPETGKSTGGRTVKRSGGGNVGSGKSSEAAWTDDDPGYGDSGSAARFFYCAKASKKDRDEGLDEFEDRAAGSLNMRTDAHAERNGQTTSPRRNAHPTVKPTDLMRYLCRLVTPPGGLVLDPFMGSGSTGKAAVLEGFRFVGIEREQEYIEIAKARIENAKQNNEPTGSHDQCDGGVPCVADDSGDCVSDIQHHNDETRKSDDCNDIHNGKFDKKLSSKENVQQNTFNF